MRPAAVNFAIPIIVCPRCGHRMRLSTIVPDQHEHERMTFSCDCGFDYHRSADVMTERML
jgi:C4-type Zn-finger protein